MELDQIIGAVLQQLDEPRRKLLDAAESVHLAFMREPYMRLILEGKKTVESRFSRNRVIPFQQVANGDALIFKKSSGPIVALSFANGTGFHVNEDGCWGDVAKKFSKAICVDDAFWPRMRERRYCTLIGLTGVTPLQPIMVEKAKGDRRAWIILRDNTQPALGDIL